MRVLSTSRMKFMRVRDLKLAQPPKKKLISLISSRDADFFFRTLFTRRRSNSHDLH